MPHVFLSYLYIKGPLNRVSSYELRIYVQLGRIAAHHFFFAICHCHFPVHLHIIVYEFSHFLLKRLKRPPIHRLRKILIRTTSIPETISNSYKNNILHTYKLLCLTFPCSASLHPSHRCHFFPAFLAAARALVICFFHP
jgi:hypothetical protein